ncbi:hypothetical protein GKQ38_05135 [Candidatus Nanohaloarchaea archaeon]|nr:hypothetical protein GKQ38_05135 [Candidatus Nanohaloarchaea archaeon]
MVTISTSRKILSLVFLLAFCTGAVAGQAYNLQDYQGADYFSAPEYDSQRELVLKLIFPFVLLYAMMQFTLYNLMKFTINSNDDMKDSEIGRYSTLLAAAIPAMLIVTPMWEKINLAVEAMGPVLLVAFACLFIYVIYRMT